MRHLLLATLFAVSGTAVAEPTFDRSSWTTWSAKWTGDFWTAGNFGTSQYMTCVSVDGSDGSPEWWTAGMGDDAARNAYQQTLDYINSSGAPRNPMYIEVHCGY